MKAKKFLMAFSAIAAITAVSCTQEDELFTGRGANGQALDGDAIAFGTYLSEAAESRAAVMDLDALKETGFGVFAYYTGVEDYNIKTPNHEPNFMYNQEVTWGAVTPESAGWQYSPVKYWPSNATEKVSFFAYAPYVASPGETGITAFLPANTAAGDPKLTFKMDEDVNNQVDLLYSNNAMNIGKQTIAETVNFRFNHALSRIGFKRVAVIDEFNQENTNDDDGSSSLTGPNLNLHSLKLTENSTVVINSVALTSAEFGDRGTFNLRTGEWDEYETASRTYTLTAENGDFINNILTPTDATEVKRLTDDDKYLMVMPTPVIDKFKNEEIPVMATVKFDVITKDPNLAGGESKISSEVTAPFKFAFHAGKSYNFVLHVGLTSVKLDATVEDWDDKNHVGYENIIVNTPVNNSYTLVLDALDGRFRNGSSYYIMSKFDLDLESGEVKGAEFDIPYFYNNKSNKDWANPINDIYWQYQLDNYGFTCWCDHIIEDLEAPMELHDKYEGQGLFKGFKYYSATPLLFEDKWADEYNPTAPELLIPSESKIVIPADDPKRYRILYAVWPIGETHLD